MTIPAAREIGRKLLHGIDVQADCLAAEGCKFMLGFLNLTAISFGDDGGQHGGYLPQQSHDVVLSHSRLMVQDQATVGEKFR